MFYKCDYYACQHITKFFLLKGHTCVPDLIANLALVRQNNIHSVKALHVLVHRSETFFFYLGCC